MPVPSPSGVEFQVAQNGSLSDFFANFGGQLEDANFADDFAVEAVVPSPAVSAAAVGHMAAVQQIQQAGAGIGYQNIPAANQGNRIVALNVPVAQSPSTAAVSQQMVYYNGLG